VEIVICDPGLSAMGSHHYNWTLDVAAQFQQLGLIPKIYAYAHCNPEVVVKTGAIPHFAHFTYGKHDGDIPFNEEQNWCLGNQSVRQDLERLETEIARPDAFVIIPAVTQHQIEGVARWFEALPSERRPKLAVSLMFFPQWTPWGQRAIRGAEYYARAIERLKPWIGRSVLLYVESCEAQACFEQLTEAPIKVLPIPWMPPATLLPAPRNDQIRFGFLGHSRRERGFHLLPEAAKLVRTRGVRFELVVQINHNHFEPSTIKADKKLRSQPSVSTIIGPIEREDYHRVLQSCDVILLPYDPTMYRARGSGLFSEAILYGKPLVVTAGTAMEKAANRGECVAESCEFNSFSLARAMNQVCSHYAEFAKSARKAARKWRKRNNVGMFCKELLAFGGLSAV